MLFYLQSRLPLELRFEVSLALGLLGSAAIAQPAQPDVKHIGDFVVRCFPVKSVAPCDMYEDRANRDTGQRVLTFSLAYMPSGNRYILQISVPLGVSIEKGVVVAVSSPALRLLGYSAADDPLRRRVVVVVPARFRQAHIAGTTLHLTNGRDVLLDAPVVVPMLRADGSEVTVELTVRVDQDEAGHRLFVGSFTAA